MVTRISSHVLDDDAVEESKIKDGAVTTDKIADDAVTSDKVPEGSIPNAKLSDIGTSPGNLAALVDDGEGNGVFPVGVMFPDLGLITNVQTFTSSGTYTPTPGIRARIFYAQAPGGGGGGAIAGASEVPRAGAGGSAGTFGARLEMGEGDPLTITIGAPGSAGSSNGTSPGGDGGTTSIGSLLSVPGGRGGEGSGTNTSDQWIVDGTDGPGDATGADLFSKPGGPGHSAIKVAAFRRTSGAGGDSFLGSGGRPIGTPFSGAAGEGKNGEGYGGGGGGAISSTSESRGGGNGAPSIVIVLEFV